MVASAKSIEKELRKAGMNAAADRLLRSAAGSVDDDRDDIIRSFENLRIQQIIDSGDMKKARKEMEQMLDDQQDQGIKVFSLVRQYIKLTTDSGQSNRGFEISRGLCRGFGRNL